MTSRQPESRHSYVRLRRPVGAGYGPRPSKVRHTEGLGNLHAVGNGFGFGVQLHTPARCLLPYTLPIVGTQAVVIGVAATLVVTTTEQSASRGGGPALEELYALDRELTPTASHVGLIQWPLPATRGHDNETFIYILGPRSHNLSQLLEWMTIKRSATMVKDSTAVSTIRPDAPFACTLGAWTATAVDDTSSECDSDTSPSAFQFSR